MKTSKRIAAVAAAIGLTVTGSMGVYAEEYALESSSFEERSVKNGKGTNSILNGNISITDISVTVPISATFDIDPNKGLKAGEPSTQIIRQANNYTITNSSEVPISIKISEVTTSATGGFTNDMDKLKDNAQQIMFAIRKAGDAEPKLSTATETTDQAKWLVPTNAVDGGVLPADYVITDDPTASELAAAGTLTMKLYGATKKGWKSGNTFTVIPTFKVSLVEDSSKS